LEIGEQRNVRVYVLDEQGLAPAAMANYEIRSKALAAQFAAQVGDICGGVYGAVKLDGIRMAVDALAFILGIGDFVHACHGIGVRVGNEIDGIARLAREMPHHVNILRRKILINEQVVHGSNAAALADLRARESALTSRDPHSARLWNAVRSPRS